MVITATGETAEQAANKPKEDLRRIRGALQADTMLLNDAKEQTFGPQLPPGKHGSKPQGGRHKHRSKTWGCAAMATATSARFGTRSSKVWRRWLPASGEYPPTGKGKV